MTEPVDLGRAALELVLRAVEPLQAAAESPTAALALVELAGWDLGTVAGLGPGQLASAASGAATAVDAVRTALAQAGGDTLDLPALAGAAAKLAQAVRDLSAFGAGWTPPTGLPANLPTLFLDDLLGQLTVLAVGRYHPAVRSTLDLLGVLAYPTLPAITRADGAVIRRAGTRPRLDLDAVANLVRDPAGTLLARFGLAGPDRLPADAAADAVLPAVAALLRDLGITAWYGNPGGAPATLTPDQRAVLAHMLRIVWVQQRGGGPAMATLDTAIALRDAGPRREVVVVPTGTLAVTRAEDAWTAHASVTGQLGAVVIRSDAVTFASGTPGVMRIEAGYDRPPGLVPLTRVGAANGTHVEIGGVTLTGFVELGGTAPGGAPRAGIELVVKGLKLAVAAPPGDGFLSSLLPPGGLATTGDLTLGWTPAGGLRLSGNAALDLMFPVGATLGPVTLDHAALTIRATEAELALLATVTATVQLGPITAVAERFGIRARVTPAPSGGNLGGAQLDVAFQPPAGIALKIDAQVVTGGGYLFGDEATGEYAGAIQLLFGGVALGAVGLLSTRMPDGRPGFSLLVLISVRFPPVQLGFGLALTGVGGLIGVNRGVDTTALRAGLPDGALSSVLFPTDILKNAPRIVRDLGRFFPVTPGQFVVGPTVELTWGAQGILTAQLGLFIEFPSPARVVLAGRLSLTLPPGANPPPVRVQVDLLGVLDFAGQTLALDGVLRDSRIGPYALSGRLAVRAGWGENPQFLVSVGGFNPRFPVPPGFPVLRRLSLALGSGDNPRLVVSAYLALTSNTVQFGGRLDASARMSVAGIGELGVSAMVSFDALITLSPFSFVVDFSLTAALTWDGDPLMSVQLDVTLSGPQPWHAVGTATIHFLGTHRLHFEVTAGSRAPEIPPVYVDLGEPLRLALTDVANWTAELPGSSAPLVTLAESARSSTTILVHPLGSLAVRQKVVPLDRDVARSGEARVRGAHRFSLGGLSAGAPGASTPPVTDFFAPAQFLDLTDAQRLSAPSFERWTSGARIDDSRLVLPAATSVRTSAAQFDTRILGVGGDGGTTQTGMRRDPVSDLQMAIQTRSGAAAVNGVAAKGASGYAGPDLGISVQDPAYAVVEAFATATGVLAELVPQVTKLPSYADALEALKATAPAGPGLLRVLANEDLPPEVA